ncbi:MAG: hypothetical protein LBH13_06430 [Cellulomonadaceae bacterium]|jgi:hypothetical protein|nr:hypothetical protein [Cellulomonadaceae bacterium]
MTAHPEHEEGRDNGHDNQDTTSIDAHPVEDILGIHAASSDDHNVDSGTGSADGADSIESRKDTAPSIAPVATHGSQFDSNELALS